MSEVVIETRKLSKEYVRDEFHVIALKDCDITIDRGDVLVRTPLRLEPGTLLETFRERIRPLEHAAVARAIRRWCLTT